MSEPGLHSVFNILLEGDNSGWIQMLVFAVLIGASAVSSIVRSRKQKHDLEEPEEEMPARSPAAKELRRQEASRALQQRLQSDPAQSPEPSRAFQERPESRPIRPEQREPARREEPGRPKPRTIIRPGSALGAFVAEIKAEINRAGDQMQGIKTPQTSLPVVKAQEPAKAFPTPPVESARTQRFVRQEPKPEADDLIDILPDFSGPDDLRRAIIYYEILGKPLSIRGRTDHLIGL